MSPTAEASKTRHKNEDIKEASNFLRGTILEGLADSARGDLDADDTQLTKFHGIYQQDDRDLRKERRKRKLDKAYCFMARVRVPGGVCTPDQWLKLDEVADGYANGTLKLTTRQAFQFHGILKSVLKPTIKKVNDALLDTIAACGDVNRNVMCSVLPEKSKVHAEVMEMTHAVADRLLPRSRAYHEVWLDEERVGGGEEEIEPIYGPTYLPRKFKTGFVVPPINDVDVFSQDLGFIAIVNRGKLEGFNVTVGGGMGMDHGKKETYPRLGDMLGFIAADKEKLTAVAEAVVTTQRDYGDRENRKHARLKYTIDDRGVDWFKARVEERSGVVFEPARKYKLDTTGDEYGWVKGTDGKWYFTLFIMSGRVKDEGDLRLKTGLREIAKIHTGDFRLTANQNLVIGKISETDRPKIEEILKEHGIANGKRTGLRLHSMSCVALPTCGLALSESERMLPGIVERLEEVVTEAGLADDAITLRITGCPNGCARPFLAEIGLVGRAPNKYNLYLGAKLNGTRLNKLYREGQTEDQVVEELTPIVRRYAKEREDGEEFGDFVIRTGYVKATTAGMDFHD